MGYFPSGVFEFLNHIRQIITGFQFAAISCGTLLFANVVDFNLVKQGQEEGGEVQEKVQDAPQELQQRQEVSKHQSVSVVNYQLTAVHSLRANNWMEGRDAIFNPDKADRSDLFLCGCLTFL